MHWCDVVCCSVMQYVAVCCSVLQCVAVCCSVLQYFTEVSEVCQKATGLFGGDTGLFDDEDRAVP